MTATVHTPILTSNITKAIITAFAKEQNVIAKVRAEQDKTIQRALDAMLTACDKPKEVWLKGNAKTNGPRGEVKALFDAIVETGSISKASGAMYQSAFWVAFNTGVEFQRDLASKAKPVDAAVVSTPKVTQEKSVVPTMDNMYNMVRQLLATARTLNQLEYAGALLDATIEVYPEFSETK